jgi:hypothetical protein
MKGLKVHVQSRVGNVYWDMRMVTNIQSRVGNVYWDMRMVTNIRARGGGIVFGGDGMTSYITSHLTFNGQTGPKVG